MAFEKLSNSIHELNENIQAFAHSNSEYYKLEFFKQSMKGVTSLVRFMVLSSVISLAFIFISFAVAIAIGEAIGVPSAGYFIVGGFYLLLFVIILVFARKPIEKFLLVKFSRVFFNE
ncbi:phage holin family protein [Salegentibacter chungangensis]|uniref:Phage holin family protein n=1 Tax=Salegentibacter chungangensis TaxID=1335724 RepID=A0ABW3NQ91_9FLAO